jgi:hypothetical protein
VAVRPPLVLLHDDGALVAVDKPAGEPVVAARGEPASACLQKRLERQIERRVWVVHRIDRDASGVVLFALDADAHRAASMAFERRRVRKVYRAVVAGALQPPSATLDLPLHAARKGKTRPALPGEAGAQNAVTDYETLRSWRLGPANVSLVEARPLTRSASTCGPPPRRSCSTRSTRAGSRPRRSRTRRARGSRCTRFAWSFLPGTRRARSRSRRLSPPTSPRCASGSTRARRPARACGRLAREPRPHAATASPHPR